MRHIFINAKEKKVEEVDLPDSLKSLQKLVDGNIELAGIAGQRHDLYVNDEGLLDGIRYLFKYQGIHQALAGNGVIVSVDENGKSGPATLSIDDVKSKVSFLHFGGVS